MTHSQAELKNIMGLERCPYSNRCNATSGSIRAA